jgi:hypothetical protein
VGERKAWDPAKVSKAGSPLCVGLLHTFNVALKRLKKKLLAYHDNIVAG